MRAADPRPDRFPLRYSDFVEIEARRDPSPTYSEHIRKARTRAHECGDAPPCRRENDAAPEDRAAPLPQPQHMKDPTPAPQPETAPAPAYRVLTQVLDNRGSLIDLLI